MRKTIVQAIILSYTLAALVKLSKKVKSWQTSDPRISYFLALGVRRWDLWITYHYKYTGPISGTLTCSGPNSGTFKVGLVQLGL
jgi:hypothetical protein